MSISHSSGITIESIKCRKQPACYKYSTNSEYVWMTFSALYTPYSLVSLVRIYNNEVEPTVLHFIICYIFLGLPLLFTQTFLGQYTQLSAIFFKHLSPLGHGIGYAMILNSFIWCCWSGSLIGDYLMYMLASINVDLDWMSCPEKHDADNCWDTSKNCTKDCIGYNTQTSAFIYWKETYMQNANIDEPKLSIGWPIAARVVPLVFMWGVGYLIVSLGIQKYKKVVRLNTYLAILLMIILLLVSFITPGAAYGVSLLFRTNFESLFSYRAWLTTVTTVIDSLGLGRAIHITYGSWMPTTMPASMLTIAIILAHLFFTIMASMITHALIGITLYAAHANDSELIYIWEETSAYFTVMPQGLSFMGVPQLWTIIFFLACILITINNMVMQVDIIEKSIAGAHFRFALYRNYILAAISISCTVVGLIFYSKEAFFAAHELYGRALLLAQLFNVTVLCILVFWIYQVQRLSDDIHFVYGSQPTKFWKTCWYILPAATIVAFLDLTLIKNELDLKETVFRIMSFVLVLPIPIFIIYEIFLYLKLHNVIGVFLPEERWGPPDPEERRLRRLFNPRQEIRSRRRNDACQHRCLVGSKNLKSIIEDENLSRAESRKAIRAESTWEESVDVDLF